MVSDDRLRCDLVAGTGEDLRQSTTASESTAGRRGDSIRTCPVALGVEMELGCSNGGDQRIRSSGNPSFGDVEDAHQITAGGPEVPGGLDHADVMGRGILIVLV